MANIETPESLQELPLAVVKNMILLATSGFGVVVALAWNEFIRAVVDNYINPFLGESGGTISLFIYAALMTLLAVVVTMQLAQLQKRLELLGTILTKKSAESESKATSSKKAPATTGKKTKKVASRKKK